jgi:hypothetical protein
MMFSQAFHKSATLVSGCLTLLFAFCWTSQCAAQSLVTYPRPESLSDQRTSYPVALLKLCERKANHSFSLRPSPFRSQQDRSLRQLSQAQGIDIVWALTTEEREQNLRPIRIPIDKGLIGWRLLMIRSKDALRFADVSSLGELSELLAVQGHDWPDVEVLRANHLKVTTGTTYEGLFKMLSFGHAQYFPRAVSEIWPELESHNDLMLAVEPNLVIYYPSALYFFVNKNNEPLAKTLEGCLEQAISDGSFEELFQRYYSDALARSQLDKRITIELKNPGLPKATPLDQPRYWYRTGKKY